MEQPVISRGTGVFVAIAVVVGACAVYVGEQAKAERLARDRQRVEQRTASEAAQRQKVAEANRQEADLRSQERAARRAAMTTADLRNERLQLQFSPWDGSHVATEQAIKARMNNPRSYAHVVTTYVDHGAGRGLLVTTKFRGTNSFNAVVVNVAVAEIDESGSVVALKFGQ